MMAMAARVMFVKRMVDLRLRVEEWWAGRGYQLSMMLPKLSSRARIAWPSYAGSHARTIENDACDVVHQSYFRILAAVQQ
jgi:hypothetical protein